MNLGIESFLLDPPYSLFLSILLITGLYKIGKLLFNLGSLKKVLSSVTIINYQFISFSILLLTLIIYPFTLYVGVNKKVIFSISIIILIFGIIHIISKLINFALNRFLVRKKITFTNLIIILFITGYFLLALAPITDSDSLDYHLATAIHIINTGYFPNDILWFHSSQSGLGDTQSIFGLIIGVEQFGSLCQFSGILSILGILLKNDKGGQKLSEKTFLTIIAFLSIPVLIFLTSTSKPQLIFIGFTALAFALVFFDEEKNLQKKDIFLKFILITLLLFSSLEGKFSFILSSLMIWSCYFFKILKRKNFDILISIFLLVLILFFSSAIWKFINYDGNFINKIYFPFLPFLDGYDNLYKSLNSCEVPCNKFLYILPISIARYTETVGIALLFIFILFLFNNKKSKFISLIIIFYILIIFMIGKFTARFLIDPVIWALLTIMFTKHNLNFRFYSLFKFAVYSQATLTLCAIWFGVFIISIGSLSNELRSKVLHRSANGYSLAKWVNKHINNNESILYTHRSISLINANVIPAEFLYYSRSKKYLEILKKKKPIYLVVQSNSGEYHKKLINCTTGIFKKKENAFSSTSRNIFNKNKQLYSGYIYNFDYKKLPSCY